MYSKRKFLKLILQALGIATFSPLFFLNNRDVNAMRGAFFFCASLIGKNWKQAFDNQCIKDEEITILNAKMKNHILHHRVISSKDKVSFVYVFDTKKSFSIWEKQIEIHRMFSLQNLKNKHIDCQQKSFIIS